MKKSTIIMFIIAGAMVLFGAGLFAGAMSTDGWRFEGLSTWDFVYNTYDVDEAFTDVCIESDTADISFAKAKNGKCYVDYQGYAYSECQVEVVDGTLHIKLLDTREWYEYISISFYTQSAVLTIYLPEDAYETLTIKESTGDVNIPEYFTFESIELEASTGDLTVCCDIAGTCSITTDTGDVEVQSVSVGALAIRTSSGDITVTDVACAGNTGVNVGSGKVNLTNVTCLDLTTTGGTGDITLRNVVASGDMDIERGTGDVTFDGCDAASMQITTNTGDVTGTLLSDKIFVYKTDTGKVRLPQTTTGGTCNITTSTGNIILAIQ